MRDSLYREHILQHYKDPHNFGVVENADAESDVSNPTCGDDLHFTAKIEHGVCVDLKFEGSGCALCVASASLLTDEVRGESLQRIKNISDEDVFTLVGLEKDSVSPMRVKCVLLSMDGVQELIEG